MSSMDTLKMLAYPRHSGCEVTFLKNEIPKDHKEYSFFSSFWPFVKQAYIYYYLMISCNANDINQLKLT